MEDSKIFQQFDVAYGIYFMSEAGFLIFSYVKNEWKYEKKSCLRSEKKSLFNDKTIEFCYFNSYNFVGCEHVFRKVQTLHALHDMTLRAF